MMSSHDPRHDALLQAVLLGDAGPESPAAAELQACAVCRERLRELRATADELHAAGREQRAVVGAALQGVDGDAARELVARAVRAGLQQRRRADRRRPWPWLALAAGLLVGLLIWSQLADGGPRDDTRDRLLGVNDFWPAGAVTAQELGTKPFEWPGHPDEQYTVSVYAADDPFAPWHQQRVTGNRYQLPGDLVAKMASAGEHWTWCYERNTRVPGSAAVDQSGLQQLSFSR